jgi:rSAM/selenodomain-associated transferase 1
MTASEQDFLVIMAKEPAPGRVKTRMVPPLTLGEASLLYEAFLEDTVDLVAGIEGIRPGLAYTPASSEGYFRDLLPAGFHLLPQAEGDLGRRIGAALEELFSLGARSVCLMNSDGPDLPPEHLRTAFEWLSGGRADAVFGPNHDGGYYLVGLREPADIFRDIPWSTSGTLAASTDAAEEAGLRWELLPPWPDLDTADDLREALSRWRSGDTRPPSRSFSLLSSLLA